MNLVEEQLSDNLIFMAKQMTATEVARNFSAVLDLVAGGETVEITRGKAVLAVLAPKKNVSWSELTKAIHEHLSEQATLTAKERKLVESLDQEVANFRYSKDAIAIDRETR